MKKICTLDIETEAIKPNQTTPKVHCIGILDDNGTTIIENPYDFVYYVTKKIQRKRIYYVHNGGGFDFYVLIKWLLMAGVELDTLIKSQKAYMSSTSIYKITIGKMVLVDSYKILPVALGVLDDKVEVIDYDDYTGMNKELIRERCISDNEILSRAVATLNEVSNPSKHTIASRAINLLEQMLGKYLVSHTCTESYFEFFKPTYVKGGVKGVYKGGLVDYVAGHWYVGQQIKGFGTITAIHKLDINSAYPNVMFSEIPCGYKLYRYTPELLEKYQESAVLLYASGDREYYFEHLVRNEEIKGIALPTTTINTNPFITKLYKGRQEAKQAGNKMLEICYKILMNSSYGKFAEDPRIYIDSLLITQKEYDKDPSIYGIERKFLGCALLQVVDLRKEQKPKDQFRDVAVASYITAKVRRKLLDTVISMQALGAIPIYCDTDCVIVCEFDNKPAYNENIISSTELGKWKYEGSLQDALIVGKKQYAYITTEGKVEKKLKGVRNELIELNHYFDMLQNKTVDYDVKVAYKISPTGGVLKNKKTIQPANLDKNYSLLYDNYPSQIIKSTYEVKNE